ncbi:cupin domain-containing protein [Salinibacterium sp. GXW1014]|uniref:cupin domain-containing protein n=1 Tax=Salinibacterium sp. GXW1014 TaxID=3377838 RepID=UPI00383A892C
MHIRRVVTGLDAEGRSAVISDQPAPRTHDFAAIPGFSNTVVWALPDSPAPTPEDITPTLTSLMPGPGGSGLTIVQFPPSAVFETIDPVAAAEEEAIALPGLADTFDPDMPGFHTTQTVDYQIVLSGQLLLSLETGEPTLVQAGDVIIQNATKHAWMNPTKEPAVLAAVSIGVAAP